MLEFDRNYEIQSNNILVQGLMVCVRLVPVIDIRAVAIHKAGLLLLYVTIILLNLFYETRSLSNLGEHIQRKNVII